MSEIAVLGVHFFVNFAMRRSTRARQSRYTAGAIPTRIATETATAPEKMYFTERSRADGRQSNSGPTSSSESVYAKSATQATVIAKNRVRSLMPLTIPNTR